MLNASELEWGPIASMAPGAMIAVIEGDLSKEVPFTFRLKLPGDYQIAPHIHPVFSFMVPVPGALNILIPRMIPGYKKRKSMNTLKNDKNPVLFSESQ